VHWSRRFHAVYRAAGGALDFAAFDPVFRAADAALARLPEVRTLGFRATVEAQARLLAERLPDGRRVPAEAVAAQFHADALRTLERNRPVVERLAARYPLAIVSNFTGNLRPCLEELGLAPLFAALSDSALLGAAKPDPRIFLSTLAALGAAPERAWMVGDNFDADIRGAAALGLRTCWVAPPDRPAPAGPGTPVPTARIARFADVEAVLG
jgi:putative hydrolase of the HAD superfamily